MTRPRRGRLRRGPVSRCRAASDTFSRFTYSHCVRTTRYTYTTMISQCGSHQQLRRALELVAEMRSRGINCNVHTYRLASGPGPRWGLELAAWHWTR